MIIYGYRKKLPNFKITNYDENHHEFVCDNSLNILILFQENGSCVLRDLYFTTIDHFFTIMIYI